MFLTKALIAAGLTGAMLAAMATAAAAQEPGNAGKGHDYARRVCAECHAVERGEARSPQPRARAFQAVAETPGMNGRAIAVWLRTPHPSMPNLVIATRDMEDLIAYILSLAEKR